MSFARRSKVGNSQRRTQLDNLEARRLFAAITVAPVTVNESAAAATFTAVLDAAATEPVTLTFTAGSGTAKVNKDFAKTKSTITIPAGQTSATFSVPLIADNVAEGNETFSVSLKASKGSTVAKKVAGTIVDDEQTPRLQVSDFSVVEGAKGTKTLVANVTLSNPSALKIKASYLTIADTATEKLDYKLARGTLTFAPGKTTRPIKLKIVGDAVFEGDEVVNLRLSNAVNAVAETLNVGGLFSRVVLVDDDSTTFARPALSVTGGSAVEGTAVPFTVSLAQAATKEVSFRYVTSAASSSVGRYTAVDGILKIPAGTTSVTIPVATIPDGVEAGNGQVTLVLSSIANATLGNTQATGTIIDADVTTPTTPGVTVTGASVVEGNTGTANLTFTVTLSAASTSTVTVDYATADGTANAGSDYTALTGTLTFAPGETSKTIDVAVTGDTLVEADETLSLILLNATNATLLIGQATGTIVNDDVSNPVSPATLAILPSTIDEPDAGTVAMTFVVNRSGNTNQISTVNYATLDGTATAGSDYVAASGTLTFAAGETSKTITVNVIGDTVVEPDETFTVVLSGATNADIATASAVGTITNTDVAPVVVPTISIADVAGSEADGALVFTVTLSAATTNAVTVNYATASGSATSGVDFAPTSGTLTFAPGQTRLNVSVSVIDDADAEGDETFTMNLSAPANGTLAVAAATGTILNDDISVPPVLPVVTVSGATVAEGNSGTTDLVFTVTLSADSDDEVTVAYTTLDGTAAAGTDYNAVSGTLTFAPHEVVKQVTVSVIGDTVIETDESFSLVLSTPTNATLPVDGASATGTILNDDVLPGTDLPSLTISDASVVEGTGSSSQMVFTVTLSQASTNTVRVDYGTAAGSAVANNDYTPTGGALFFAPGETVKTISVTIIGDSAPEDNLTLEVKLLNPVVNATIADGSGVGTIIDDDSPVSDNRSLASSGVQTAAGANYLAASFTTSTDASTLTAVVLQLAQTTAGSAVVEIHADNAGVPGALVGTLTSPTGYTSTLSGTPFTGSVALSASTTYWVVLRAPTGAFSWSSSSVTPGSNVGSGYTGVWAQSSDSGTTWLGSSTSPLQMLVNARPGATLQQ